jgi:hypothetical protein
VRHLASRLAIAAILLSVLGCTRVDPRKTEEALEWLRSHYREFPIGGGWTVTGVAADGSRLNVYVDIPDSQAAVITEYDWRGQLRAIGAACPNEHEHIWKIMDPNHHLYIRSSTKRLGSFLDADCTDLRRYGL